MIERTDSQQTTCNATATVGGEKRQVATATCSIRPGRSMIFSVDLPPGTALEPEDAAQIKAMFETYMAGELEKARGMGIPI